MPTIRAILSDDHIRQAKAAAQARLHTREQPLIFADDRDLGLSIRVQLSTASWILKYRKKTKSLGSLKEIDSVSKARKLAQDTRAVIDEGVGDEVKRYVRQRRKGKTDEQAVAVVAVQQAKAAGKWRWEDLARRYSDDYLSKPRRTKRGLRPPSLKSAAEARRYLNDPVAMKHLGGRLLIELRRGDFEAVRNELLDVHKRKTASRQFVALASAAMTYARRKFGGDSGLEDVARWWLEVEPRDESLTEPKTRFPELPELARVLRVAETTPVMPGREIKRTTSEVVLCSLWWVALTAQRTTAALRIRKAHIIPWDGPEPGWLAATFPVEDMKGRRFHAIPIPPRAALLLDRVALSADPASEFVFPAQRMSSGKADGSLYRSTPRLLIERLRGRPADLSMVSDDEDEGPSTPGPNLLDGIARFSPHDLRRTFATACGELAVRGDAISAVLDHADGTYEGPKQSRVPTAAEITRLVYDHSQRMSLKAIAMQAWTDALFDACDEEWARGHVPAVRPVPVPRRPGEPYPERPTFRDWEPWYRTMERWEAGRPKASPGSLRLGEARRAMEDSEREDA